MLHFIFEMEQRRLRLETESKQKYSQCLLVKLGLLGPERVTRLMPPFRRSGGLLVKIGILGPKNCSGSIESEIAASSGDAGSSWPGERDTTSADVTALAKSVVEARPPGIALHSATTVAAAVAKYGGLGEAGPLEAAKCRAATESELAESFGELPARLLGLAKYRLRRSRQLTLLQS